MTSFQTTAQTAQAAEEARVTAHNIAAQEQTRLSSVPLTTREDLQRIAKVWRDAVDRLPYHAAQEIQTADGIAWRLTAAADTAPICDTSPGAPRWHTIASERASRPVLGAPKVSR